MGLKEVFVSLGEAFGILKKWCGEPAKPFGKKKKIVTSQIETS